MTFSCLSAATSPAISSRIAHESLFFFGESSFRASWTLSLRKRKEAKEKGLSEPDSRWS